jgi:hypothetical protein
MKKSVAISTLFLGALFLTSVLFAQDREGDFEFYVKKTDKPPVLDGILNDEAWDGAELETGVWLTDSPYYGLKLEQQCRVYAAYDDFALYFAFKCYDPNPEQIKTSVSRRDSSDKDDWICIILDPSYTRQVAYQHMVNPNGIQSDAIFTASGNWDKGVDWVWDCSAALNSEGYDVEMSIPLKSIRYHGGEESKMGICFRQRITRSSSTTTWPDLPTEKSIFNVMATLIYQDLRTPRTFELLPSVTYAYNSDRSGPETWSSADDKKDIGVNIKYGFTSTVTLECTLNPDFSQVESDEYQVEVNQRDPLFYTEKRPFFMEGLGYFQMPMAGPDMSMTNHIHTRRIVNPQWGAKLTGSIGKLSFASLTAADSVPFEQAGDDGGNLLLEQNKLFSINRAMVNWGGQNYIGAVATDVDSDSGFNRSLGMDIYYLTPNHRISGFVFQTFSRDRSKQFGSSGWGGSLEYAVNKRSHIIWLAGEHYDKDFRLDTALYKRTGITFGNAYFSPKFYPDRTKYSWFKMFRPWVSVRGGPDRVEGGTDFRFIAGFSMIFAKRGQLAFRYTNRREPWAGKRFDVSGVGTSSGVQLTKELYISGEIVNTKAIFYDPETPFSGKLNSRSIKIDWQATARFQQTVQYIYSDFCKAEGGDNVYTVWILNTKSVYQFNEQFFLRAVVQYNSIKHRILTDFLASYTLVPGTVVYAGYGSLIEKRQWEEDHWIPGAGGYLTTRRSLFFKASYLWRF